MKWRDPSAPVGVGAHETTTRNLGALYPQLADTTRSTPGIFIGLDLLGGPYTYDPFELYNAGILTNPNAIIFGQIGRGKSALVKTYLLRQVAFGRSVFVLDPKGEYGAFAETCGVTPLQLRPGGPLRLNPLDLPDGNPELVISQRLQLLEALASSSMGRALVPRERAAVEVALEATSRLATTPTLGAVVDHLLAPSREAALMLATTVSALGEEGRDVALALRRLVKGDLAGMFDEDTSAVLNLSSPVTCLDLSALYGSPALGILMICAASWLQGAVRARAESGERSLFVIDEAWAVLRDVAVARWLQASWKLARSWGVSNLAVLHRISDLAAVGEEGSEERNLANGILLDSETKILYAQPSGELAHADHVLGLTPAERDVLPRLARGVALWNVAGRSSLVQHLLGPDELNLVDSDHAMREP